MINLPASPTEPTVFVVGATSADDALIDVLPEWARQFGRDAVAVVALEAPKESDGPGYQRLAEFLRDEYHAIGALMLSHAATMFDHARTHFDELDGNAEATGEIGVAVRAPGRLAGRAPSVVAARRAFASIIDDPADCPEVLVIGAEGDARAIAIALSSLDGSGPSRRVTVTAFDGKSMSDMRRRIAGLPEHTQLTLRHIQSPAEQDRLVTLLPPGSAVVNAVGAGDPDAPAPVTPAALFPEQGVVWDLTSAADSSPFLDAARRQRPARHLRLSNGVLFKKCQWLEYVSSIFGSDPEPTKRDALLDLIDREKAA